jgi:type VI secretion system secreted protein Hcp
MSESCHLWLKADGQDVQGDSTIISMGRENTIECLKFEHLVQTSRERGGGMVAGHRIHGPIIVTKRIDKSTPLLYKALRSNSNIDGQLKFYRPNPNGDGTTEHFFTIEVKDGRISSIREWVPNTLDPNTASLPAMEEVSIVYRTIGWTYVPTGAEDVDEWQGT